MARRSSLDLSAAQRASLAAKLGAPRRDPTRLPIEPGPPGSSAPLSFPQQRLWFLHRLEPDSIAYSMTQGLTVEGDLQPAALRGALDRLVTRHDILRTRYVDHAGVPEQVVDPAGPAALTTVDLRELPADSRAGRAAELLAAEASSPFDLTTGPVMRVLLLRVGERRHELLVNIHHIASDGWSHAILFDELGRLYADLAAGREPALAPLSVRYADYARWQRQGLTAATQATLLDHWRGALSGMRPLDLPLDRPRPARRTLRGGGVATRVTRASADRLRALAEEERASPFMVLLAAWSCALGRFAGQDDFGIGTVSAGRARRELEPLIGFFVDTLVIRADLGGDPTFQEVLRRTRERSLAAFAHQDLPFEVVVDALAPRRRAGGNPLFRVMFVMQTTPAERHQLGDLVVRSHEPYLQGAPFDLSLVVSDDGAGGFLAGLGFDDELFDRETAAALLDGAVQLLDEAVAAPSTPLSRLPLPAGGRADRRRSRDPWRSFPPGGGLHAAFEAAAALTPDATALVAGEERLLYRELDERANQLAHRLLELGVGPEVRVAVYIPRSIDWAVALLAILKAGGAYVPLDPSYPPARLALVVDDADPIVTITSGAARAALPARVTRVLRLDDERDRLAAAPRERPNARTWGASPACVLYTSGSTGRPKGVVLTHDNLRNEIAWMADVFPVDGSDRVLQQASIGFDVSMFETFWALFTGAALVLPKPDAQRDPDYLVDLFQRQSVTAAFFVPSLLNLFLAAAGVEACTSLRCVLVGGEALPLATVESFARRLPDTALHNLYGPTETGCTTWHPCRAGDPRALVPIGRSIANMEVHLLDRGLAPVAEGAIGEVHAGGANVARGYLGRPALTAERFVPDPSSDLPGARLYRTGDLGRSLSDGSLEYLGRSDHQIKIRGVRVELQEIEAVLSSHPDVQEAAVVARGASAGDLRLVAYLVARSGPIAAGELSRFARDRLPPAMIPSAFVGLGRMPLSPNGKVDRLALAELEDDEAPSADVDREPGEPPRIPPRTPIEALVTGIFAVVTGRTEVGADDDFFDLGGHSLSATQVVARVRDALGIDLPLRVIFEAPTPAGLAARLAASIEESRRTLDARDQPPLRPVARGGHLPLSFAQQRLWFLEELAPGSAVYNLPVVLRLRGRLDQDALQRSLETIVQRHEVLRTRFVAAEGEPRQEIVAGPALPLPVIDLAALGHGREEAEARRRVRAEAERPFDLAAGPPVRAALYRLADDDHVLLFAMHHIVADGWSIAVWTRELGALYAAFRRGEGSPLAELPVQYADYAAWQREWLSGELLAAHLRYWTGRMAGAPSSLELPTDRPRPAVPGFRGAVHELAIPPELAAALTALGRRENATLFMTLLAGFQVLLRRYTGQEDIVVGTPIANRPRTELEGLIGLFVNTLALRTEVAGDLSFRALLRRVRETTLGAYAHQDLPLEKLVEALSPVRDRSRSPLFQVTFALQNTPSAEVALPDLTLAPVPVEDDTAKFDLSLALIEEPGGKIAGAIEYRTDLFDPATIERMAGHYRTLLRRIADAPDDRIAALSPLRADEELQLLAWGAAPDRPRGGCLHQAFEAQVDRTPDAVAVAFGAEEVSYRELDRRANQLARHLRRRGLEPGARIGLCLERCPDLIAAVLAIWKAGCAYVPLDPAYPAGRLEWLIGDARPAAILTAGAPGDALPPGLDSILRLDRSAAAIARESGERLAVPVDDRQVAYVIYTSGSSGRPKGVLVPHRGVADVARAQARALGAEVGRRVLQLASLNFDASVSEIMMALVAGGTLILTDREALLPGPDLVATLSRERIHIATFSPSLLAVLPARALPLLDTVIVAGEACPEELIARWGAGRRIVDAYGPTEASICATMGECAAGAGKPGIGRPIAGARVLVLDEALALVPIGVPGELWIGGEGLAHGYIDRPDLTAARFAPDPFADRPGARIYRTGDQARWRPDGTLDYLGRLDEQVKLRGQRIELGEIEARLLDAPGVSAAAVVVHDADGDRRLVAYVVPRAPGSIDPARLRDHLAAHLPAVMVPSAVVSLDALPLGPNGKLDRRALPPPDQEPVRRGELVAPRTPLERELVALWESLLRVAPIGVSDDFFALGGHSLLAVRLVARIEHDLGRELSLSDLFRGATVAEVAAALEAPARRSTSVVTLEAGGAAPTLVCVHAFGGSAWSYRPLAAALGATHPVVALHARGLDDDAPPIDDIAAMARSYLDDLAAAGIGGVAGSAWLAGWSFGALIAHEMACQLAASGRAVAGLLLLDPSWPPGSAGADPTAGAFAPADVEEHAITLLARELGLDPPELADVLACAAPARFDHLVETSERRGLFPAGLARAYLARMRRVQDAHRSALARHRMQRYRGRTILVRARDQPESERALLRADPPGGWSDFLAEAPEIHELPGDHDGLLRPPHVDALARTIGGWLDRGGRDRQA